MNRARDKIIEAAARLFAQQGFRATSTREIADSANVNEATLFRIFTRKKDLFWVVVESQLTGLQISSELGLTLAADQELAVVLPLIFRWMVGTARQEPQIMRLLYFATLELPGADDLYRRYLGPVFGAITEYLSRCAARGTIQDVDAVLALMGLAGTVMAQHTLQSLLPGVATYADANEAISAYTQFWLRALLNPCSVEGVAARRQLDCSKRRSAACQSATAHGVVR